MTHKDSLLIVASMGAWRLATSRMLVTWREAGGEFSGHEARGLIRDIATGGVKFLGIVLGFAELKKRSTGISYYSNCDDVGAMSED